MACKFYPQFHKETVFIVELFKICFFGLSVFCFFHTKLLVNGEFSVKTGLNYADILTIFPSVSFKVDKVPPNFVLPSNFPANNVKSLGSLLSLHYSSVACCLIAYLVIAVGLLAYLYQIAVWSYLWLGQAVVWMFAKKTKPNAVNA